MNHRVPDFHELEDDDSNPTPSISRPEKPTAGEEEIMELLWKNGHVVVQSQNQRSSKRSASGGEVVLPAEEQQQQQHLLMQEYEMSWLHYPLDDSSFDGDFYADLLNSAHPPPTRITATAQPRAIAEIRPPPPILSPDPPRVHNFVHFSRLPIRPRMEAVGRAKESTVVESNETPAVGPELMKEESAAQKGATTSAAAGELASGTCDITITSSPEASPSSFSEDTREPQPQPQPQPSAAKDRKRKAKEAEDTECQSEDIEFETKKQARGSASTKRSRAAEVHNLSERRRRDRINEKMRALQDLIPRCNKSDKASMLDEAIEYLKSLQLQVQMMSMGCGMVPMMYPRMNQYMPAMGIGMGTGMGMNRPMVPYPPMMPNPAAHMAPPFPLPPPDPHPNLTIPQLRVPGFVDPYRQYLGFHHSQLPLPQNQDLVQPNANKASNNEDVCNPVRKLTVLPL